MNKFNLLFWAPIILIVSGLGVYFFVGKTENVCTSQNLNQEPEKIVTDIVNEFERFRGQKNIKLLSTCLSKPLADKLLIDPAPFPFYAIKSYFIKSLSKISETKYSAIVNEQNIIYQSGISGGSYPERNVDIYLILEKDTSGTWLVNMFRKTPFPKVPSLGDEFQGGTADMSDWKTYRNEQYGFEIKYPSEWLVNAEGFGIVNLMSSSVSSGLAIHTEEISERQTLDQFLKIRDSSKCEGVPCVKVLTKKEIMVANYPAIQRKESWSDCPCTGQTTYFRWNNLVYIFSGAPISSDSITEKEETVYNKILSTFRVVKIFPTSNIMDASNYLTYPYRDEKFGFEFRYPNIYKLDASFNQNTESETRRIVTLGLKNEFYPREENLSFSGVSIGFIVNKNILDCRERNYDSIKEINNQNFLFDRKVGMNDLETQQVIFNDYYLKTNNGCYLLHSSISWVTQEINTGRTYAHPSKSEIERLEKEILNIVSTFNITK